MAFQVVPNTAHFAIMGVMATGQSIINDVYVRNTILGWSATRLAATGTVIGNAWRDDIVTQVIGNTYTFDKVRCRDLGSEFGATTDVEYNTVGAGGTPATPALCVFVKFIGTGGSPPRRGGNFVSPMNESQISGDFWDAGTTGTVQTGYQNMLADISAATPSDAMVIVSRYSKNANPTPPHLRTEAVTNTIAGFEAIERVAVQRDRRTGEGS